MTLWADAATLPVERLTAEARVECGALAVDREWGEEEPKWRLLFDVAEVYGIRDPGGRLVATYTLTRYGTSLAAVGMVLVASRLNGRGLGRRLMTHALEAAGDAVVCLYATEQGRPLYEKLGFEVVEGNTTYVGEYRPVDRRPPVTRPLTDADLPAVLACDRDAFGADRAALLTALRSHAAGFRVAESGGRITGFAAAWRNTKHHVIGPVVAEDQATARDLVADLAAGADAPVRVDVLHSRGGFGEWVAAQGMGPAFDTSFMVLGGAGLPADPERVFVPVTQAV